MGMATLWAGDLSPSRMCGTRGVDGRGAALTFPLLARRDPVLARLSKASSALRDQLQLLLLCPFPPGAAFISCEALVLWEPSHPASSWLNDRPIKEKPIKPRCKNSTRAVCLPIFFMHEPDLGAGGGRDTPKLRRGDP